MAVRVRFPSGAHDPSWKSREGFLYIYTSRIGMKDFEVAYVAKKFARDRSDKKSRKLVGTVRQAEFQCMFAVTGHKKRKIFQVVAFPVRGSAHSQAENDSMTKLR